MPVRRVSQNGALPNEPKPTLTERNEKVDQALACRYDALNQKLSEAERHLRSLKPMYDVWVTYNYDEHGNEWEVLGLCQHQGKWRLCHAFDNEDNYGSPIDVKPIVECPAVVRVEAAKVVRKLHEKIVQTKEEQVPAVDKAIKELSDLCDEF